MAKYKAIEAGLFARVIQSGGGLGETLWRVESIENGVATIREVGTVNGKSYAPQTFPASMLAQASALKWWNGSNGNRFADYGETRYCLALEDSPLGAYWNLSANGKTLGGSNVKALAETMAERHAATGRV